MKAVELLEVERAMTEPDRWKAEDSWNNAGMPLADFTIPGHNGGATVEMLAADAHGAVAMRRHWAALVALLKACEAEYVADGGTFSLPTRVRDAVAAVHAVRGSDG